MRYLYNEFMQEGIMMKIFLILLLFGAVFCIEIIVFCVYKLINEI